METVKTIQEQLTERLHKAMKEKNEFERDFIRVILAEFSRKGKSLSDNEAIEELLKMRNNLRLLSSVQALMEVNFLNIYIPLEMTEEHISEVISTLIDEMKLERSIKSMGKLVNEFKSLYPGQDGAVVAKLAKKLLV